VVVPGALADTRRTAAVLVLALGFEVFLLVQSLDQRTLTAVESGFFAAASALATWACARRARQEEPGGHAQGWALLAAAAGCFAAAQLGYLTESLLRSPLPEPGDWWSNAAASLTVPFAALALLRLASTAAVTRPLVTLLDGLVVGLSWLFISWALVLGPAYREAAEEPQSHTALLYFLAGSLALVGLVLALAMRWSGDAGTLAFLAVACSWLGATQVVYSVRAIDATYRIGDPVVDTGWLVPLLLLFLAASRAPTGAQESALRRRVMMTLVVPYASVVLAAITYYVLLAMGEQLDLLLEVTGVTNVLLILLRFSLTLREHHALTTDLERQVLERTEAARLSKARLQSLLHHSSDVIAVVDHENRFAYISPAAGAVLGQVYEDLRGKSLLSLVHPDDRASVAECLEEVRREPSRPRRLTFRIAHPDGHWCHAEATVAVPQHDPQIPGPVLNIRDVSDRTALEEELRVQATYDPLTGLGNRRLLQDRARHALDRGARHGEPLSVLYVDLDHFKRINDTAGHAVGDQVLTQVADRLRSCLRPADTAVRLGGDEFAVLLEDTSEEHAHEVAQRVMTALEPPYRVGERTLTVTASVGLTTARSGTADAEALIRDADVAMYQAKAHGRARLAVFEPEMHTELVEQMTMETELREAIDQERLRLHYQPVLDLRTGAITGVEALARWPSGALRDVPPALFIPLAEDRGLILQLDAWALRAACRQVRHWQARFPHHRTLRLSVNLSALDLRDPDLVARVRQVLAETELDPACLMVEVTETAVLPDPDEIRGRLGELRSLGVGISMDDFGTGYGSLAALRALPLDEIKLDQTFVAGMEGSAAGRRLVEAILRMAHALDLETVAEAVETRDQLAWLRRMRCGAAQGFLFAPPLDPAAMTDALRNGGLELPFLRRRLRRPAEARRAGAVDVP